MPGMTVSPDEVARFDALAARWWDPDGPMRPLHQMNPARVAWIADWIGAAAAAAESTHRPAAGAQRRACASTSSLAYLSDRLDLRILDVGCGAGVAAEALARLGYDVVGIDAAGEAIEAARAHATGQELPLTYRTGTAEDLLTEQARFPVITALEVIEHVPDPLAFLTTLAGLLTPGGQLFLSTLNRTPQSFLAAKVGAEYLLRWLPRGTHNWRQFITPIELDRMLRQVGMRVCDITGLIADPVRGHWTTDHNLSVNYLLVATG